MVRHVWTALFLLFDVGLLRAEKTVFLEPESATTILGRGKRDNSGLFFEEFWQANLERECNEERCSHEEAREYFENDIETERFWKTYDGNPCFPNPCQNGGTCIQVSDKYECRCSNGIQGGKCEKEQFVCGKVYKRSAEGSRRASSRFEDSPKNADPRHEAPTYTKPRDPHFYWQKKTMDFQSCERPWEAWLVNKNNQPLCAGVILDQHFVLTSAHCIVNNKYFRIDVGTELEANSPASTHEVDIIILHSKFDDKLHDYDLALVKLAEPIVFNPRAGPACIPETAFPDVTLPPFRRAKCCQFLHPKTSNYITENMFCASSCNKGVHPLPHFTPYKDTYFVTGIASWRGNCTNGERQQVFTSVFNLVHWIQSIMCNVRNGIIAAV